MQRKIQLTIVAEVDIDSSVLCHTGDDPLTKELEWIEKYGLHEYMEACYLKNIKVKGKYIDLHTNSSGRPKGPRPVEQDDSPGDG